MQRYHDFAKYRQLLRLKLNHRNFLLNSCHTFTKTDLCLLLKMCGLVYLDICLKEFKKKYSCKGAREKLNHSSFLSSTMYISLSLKNK